MGVSIYPGGASWSYGGFGRFRRDLAREEGLDLAAMRGFGGAGDWETTGGQHVTPLAPLLNHSDCDGHLESFECEEVAPRLELILSRWDCLFAIRDAIAERFYGELCHHCWQRSRNLPAHIAINHAEVRG